MISVFTPTHDTKFILELHQSLKEQTYQDWEWVIVPNNGAVIPELNDKRVKVFPFDKEGFKIGELKRFCATKCKGKILVEVDHDDLLTEDCLEEINKAFESDEEISMVYSDWAQIKSDWTPQTWSNKFGWEFYNFEYKGHQLLACKAPHPHPANLGRIYYAPNHVRAWKTEHYWRIGGHNKDMKISDDHELVARNFVFGKIHLIPKCLYIYRVHGENTWLGLIPEIRKTMWENYTKYIIPMMSKWADNNGLLKVDLCGGINKYRDFTSVDIHNGDITADLNEKWPFEDNSVGVIWASDAVEHLTDPIHVMNEAYRVLHPTGMIFINVPSTDGVGAWCDPTHKSFWNIRSFRYYTEKDTRKYIEPMCNCRFQIIRLLKGNLYDNVPYVFAHLLAIKNNERIHGTTSI